MIKKLRAAGYGAFTGQYYFGCLLYAYVVCCVPFHNHNADDVRYLFT